MQLSDLAALRDQAKTLLAQAQTPEAREAIEKGLAGLDQVRGLLDGLRRGDTNKVEAALTQWEDVNRTLVAIGKINAAIERSKSVNFDAILTFVGKAMKVALTLATA